MSILLSFPFCLSMRMECSCIFRSVCVYIVTTTTSTQTCCCCISSIPRKCWKVFIMEPEGWMVDGCLSIKKSFSSSPKNSPNNCWFQGGTRFIAALFLICLHIKISCRTAKVKRVKKTRMYLLTGSHNSLHDKKKGHFVWRGRHEYIPGGWKQGAFLGWYGHSPMTCTHAMLCEKELGRKRRPFFQKTFSSSSSLYNIFFIKKTMECCISELQFHWTYLRNSFLIML